jgi:hypothetical protein
MGKASRIKRRAMKSQRRVRRGGGSYGFYGAVFAICLVGVSLIAVSKANKSDADVLPRANEDHWHAALGVNVCGSWLANATEFHDRVSQSGIRAGLHSHGDGLIHAHPYSGDESGKNATVGRFFKWGGWKLDTDTIQAWDGQEHQDGDKCGEGKDAKKAEVRWSVNDEEQKGNPASYKLRDQDVIAIYFVAKDVDLATLGDVPGKANLANPSDLDPSATTVPSGTTGPSATTVDGSGSSTTAPPGSSSSTPSETTTPTTAASATVATTVP